MRRAGRPGPASADGAADDARDRALLAAHTAGDADAFGRLVALHRDRLYAVAVRTLSGPSVDAREEAADALQDAFLSAYRAAGSYRGEARVGTWLHRIVVNACLDLLRRRAVRPTVPLDDRAAQEASDDGADGDRAMDVRAALAGLPLEQRTALVLVDLGGMSVGEAAAVLGVPVGTVKSRCSRGRARLALSLAAWAGPVAAEGAEEPGPLNVGPRNPATRNPATRNPGPSPAVPLLDEPRRPAAGGQS